MSNKIFCRNQGSTERQCREDFKICWSSSGLLRTIFVCPGPWSLFQITVFIRARFCKVHVCFWRVFEKFLNQVPCWNPLKTFYGLLKYLIFQFQSKTTKNISKRISMMTVMLVTIIGCWWQNFYLGNIFWMLVSDKNGQNRHQRLSVVTDTFRLQHRFPNSNLENKTQQNPYITLTNLCLDSVNFTSS